MDKKPDLKEQLNGIRDISDEELQSAVRASLASNAGATIESLLRVAPGRGNTAGTRSKTDITTKAKGNAPKSRGGAGRAEMRNRMLQAALARQARQADDEAETPASGGSSAPLPTHPVDAVAVEVEVQLQEDAMKETVVQEQEVKAASKGKAKAVEVIEVLSSDDDEPYVTAAAAAALKESTAERQRREYMELQRSRHAQSAGSRKSAAAEAAKDVRERELKAAASFFSNRVAGLPEAANKDTVTLESLLRKDQKPVEHALFMAMQADLDWLRGMLPPRTPVTVVQAYDKEKQSAGHFQVDGFTTLVRPPMPMPYCTFHIKLCILMFSSAVRIVVTTANLVEVEWTRVDQDFPLAKKELSSAFRDVLEDVMSAVGLSGSFLREYDFSSAQVDLVASVPGRHKGSALGAYGQFRLRTLLSDSQSIATGDRLVPVTPDGTVTYRCSSVGMLTPAFFNSIQASMAATSTLPAGSLRFQLAYPTTAQVAAVPRQLRHPELLCLSRKVQEKLPPGILHTVRTCPPVRERLVPHLKLAVKMGKDNDLQWVYMGSHNLSMSAWGAPEHKGIQLRINNYELGVLLRPRSNPPAGRKYLTAAAIRRSLPMNVPAMPYATGAQPFVAGFQ